MSEFIPKTTGQRFEANAKAGDLADRREVAEWDRALAKRAPPSAKAERARQAELYAQALGIQGACEAMGIGPWQLHNLRRWLRNGAPVPHPRRTVFKPKVSQEAREAIISSRGREKVEYLAALHGVHRTTIQRIWAAARDRIESEVSA